MSVPVAFWYSLSKCFKFESVPKASCPARRMTNHDCSKDRHASILCAWRTETEADATFQGHCYCYLANGAYFSNFQTNIACNFDRALLAWPLSCIFVCGCNIPCLFSRKPKLLWRTYQHSKPIVWNQPNPNLLQTQRCQILVGVWKACRRC